MLERGRIAGTHQGASVRRGHPGLQRRRHDLGSGVHAQAHPVPEEHPGADPRSVRDTYLAEFGRHQAAVETVCRTLETDLVRVRTDDDLGRALSEYLRKRNLLPQPTQDGVHFWSAIYIPVVVAMAAQQNVVAALKGGPAAILAGVLAVVVCFALIPLVERIGREEASQPFRPQVVKE